MTENGTFVELAFQPNGQVNFSYDGIPYNAITTYTKNRWFNVVFEFNSVGSINGKLDGVEVFNESIAADHLTEWTFYSALSTAPDAFYVDNFCTGYCDDCLPPNPGGPYNYDCDIFQVEGITPLPNNNFNVTLKANGVDAQSFEVIDSVSGNIICQQNITGSNAAFGCSDFGAGNTYIICLYYLDDEGCLRRCCMKLYIPVNCGLFSPYFIGDDNNLDFALDANVDGTNLEVVSWWYDSQNIGSDTETTLNYPTPGTYRVCCLLYDPFTRCYILCCRELCIENPLDCNSIDVDYDIIGQEYILTANGVQQVLSWNIDLPLNVPNNGFIGSDNPQRFKPEDFNITAGQEITISVRYIDDDGCLRVCCKRLCPPIDPTQVCNFITPVYLGSGLDFYFSAEDTPNISDVRWSLHIPGGNQVIEIGNGLRSDDLNFEELKVQYPSLMLEKVCISISYRDDVTGCYKICCKCFCIESSPLTCNDISAVYILDDSSDYIYAFELNIASSSDIEWTLDNTNTNLGSGSTIEVNFQDYGFSAGDRVYVTVRYYDTSSDCFKVCCKVICLEEPVLDCDLIDSELQADGNYNLNFTGSSSQVNWIIEGIEEIQFGTEATLDLSLVSESVIKVCVLYLDSSGCCRICCVEIDTDCSLDINLGDDLLVCDGSTRSLAYAPNGSEASIEWFLNGSNIASNINVITADVSGEYSLLVSDDADCTGSDVISIEYFEILNCSPFSYSIDPTNPSLANFNHNILNGISYEWDFGDGNNSTDPSTSINHEYQSAGVYTVCLNVTDACDVLCNHCLTISTEDLNLDAVITDGGCGANPDFGSIDLFISGGQSPYQIDWSNGQVNVDPLSNLEAGSYSVTITDNSNTTVSVDYVVNVFETVICRPLTYSISNINDNTVIFNNLIENGVSYDWDFGDGNSSSSNDGSVEHEYLAAGIYSACLTVEDGCGDLCVQCATVAIDIIDILIESIVSDGGCTDGPLGSIALSVSGGSEPYVFNWSNGSEQPTIQDLEAGNYSVTVTDNSGNTIEENFTIEIFDDINCNVPLFAEADNDNSSIITFTQGIENGTSYEWDFGDNSIIQDASPTVVYQYDESPGIYSACLTVTNDCGGICVQCITIAIQTFYIDAEIVDVSCDSLGFISLNVTGGVEPYSYSWDTGSNLSSQSDLAAGQYAVTVTDQVGDQIERNYEISDDEASLISQGDTAIIVQQSELIELIIEGATDVLWMSSDFDLDCEDCFETSFIANGVGQISAFAVDDNGCSKTIIYTISIEDSLLFGPNMITPNGDGYNDVLEFVGIEQFPSNRLTIFNRWGEVLLNFEGYENDWSAQKNSKNLPDGVYYYVLEYGVNSTIENVLKRDLLVMRER